MADRVKIDPKRLMTFNYRRGLDGYTVETIQAIHLEQIAVRLDLIANELARRNRVDDDFCERWQIADAALELMNERSEIESWFEDGHMRLSEFTSRIQDVFGWSALHGKPVEAINRTNYLRAERKGGGYRVYLLREGEDAS